ncbi:hypothetical protein CM49_04388 [Paenibacillus sp. P1XP2]|nr:hypothetical protein CM49_04388 [Paenibacillus sp. P1XP2]
MPKLEPEIGQRIDYLLEDGYITRSEAKLLEAYFTHETRAGIAHALRMQKGSVNSVLSTLKRAGVLMHNGEGYELSFDNDTINRVPKVGPPIQADPDLVMTEKERKWMLENYGKYRKNRSEAARILGRSKFDICRMAIALGIDQKNSR